MEANVTHPKFLRQSSDIAEQRYVMSSMAHAPGGHLLFEADIDGSIEENYISEVGGHGVRLNNLLPAADTKPKSAKFRTHKHSGVRHSSQIHQRGIESVQQ